MIKEKAILVGLVHKNQTETQLLEYIDELAFLADTAGANCIKRFTQRLASPDSHTFIGSGKLNEIATFVQANDVTLAIFDDELKASHIRNIEKVLGANCRVVDRPSLILDIFAKRARTAQSRAQVELAQCKYLLPRLTRMWTHLERQKGGIGLRGPGETEIETDRRVIREKISRLEEKLKLIDKQNATQRKSRGEMIRVALVGYTNVGKSTIMNLLSKSEVFAENKLFATLDTTVRKVVIDTIPFLLSDTVGFIRKLPHDLVESFKSTLDEVREADMLLHVIDISHPQFEDHIKVVNETLVELNAADKPTILVFNKIDLYTHYEKEADALVEENEVLTLEELKNLWVNKSPNNTCIFISATKKLNISEFRNLIYDRVKFMHMQRYPNYLSSSNNDLV